MAETPDETPYQSLYRRFRPSTFGEVRGQDHVVLALRNAVRDGRVAHAYLFSGPRGTGKTSTARILAKALNCTDLRDGEPCGVCASCVEIAKGTSLDVHELDAASNNGVEAMRDLVSRAALGTPGRQKVYIVDEVHMLSTPASNALLKTLEEPPAHVVFVLATTDPQKVLPTIRSRTQHFEFRLLGPETLGDLLEQVRRDAHLDVPDEALDLAVRRGRGSARDALSVLDQVVASDSVDDDLPELDEVVEALAERDVGRALVAVAHLTSAGFSPQQLAGDLVDYLRQGFLALVAPDLLGVPGTEQDGLSAQAERVGLATLVRAMEVLGEAQVVDAGRARPAGQSRSGPGAPGPPRGRRFTAGPADPHRASGSRRTGGPVASPTPPARPAARRSRRKRSTAPESPEPRRRTRPAPVGQDVGSGAPTGGAAAGTGAASRPHDPSPAAAAGPPPSAPGPEPSTPVPTRDQLVQAWGDHIIGRLRPKAKALFQAGRFVGVEDDKAVFGLPNEIHRDRCEEVRGEIESALADHFGRPVGLVLVVDDGTDGGPGAGPNPRRAGRVGRPASSAPVRTSPPRAPGPAPPMSTRPGPCRTGGRRAPRRPRTSRVFDESELGEVADIDNSAESRVLKAFPGAEEVG